jgi:hypothetical protein
MLLDEAVAADWSNSQIDRAVNYAYHELITSIVETFEEYFVKTTTLDTVADQQEYGEDDGLPDDFFKIRRVEINYDPDNSNSSPERAYPIILDEITRDVGNENWGVVSHSHPNYYLIGHGSTNMKLGFIPIPSDDGTDAIKLWYVYIPDDLSEGSDEIDIPYPNRYGRLISLGAAGDLLRKGQLEEVAAARYRAEFELGLEKMKQQLEDRKADDVKSITDVISQPQGVDRTNII